MPYDRNQQSGCGAAAAVILVALMLGFLVLAVGGFFFLRASRVERQMVAVQEVVVASQEKAERIQVEAELERDQLLAEAEPDNSTSATVKHFTIAIDEDGNASVDGNVLLRDELQSKLRTMIDESSGQVSLVVRVDGQCRFEHVAVILSQCEEAGIENPRLTASDK